jgi:hypothetical protein
MRGPPRHAARACMRQFASNVSPKAQTFALKRGTTFRESRRTSYWQGATYVLHLYFMYDGISICKKYLNCLLEAMLLHGLRQRTTTGKGLSAQRVELQGSMLWSQFSAILANFWRKNWRFSQKPMLWSKFCIIYLYLVWVKNANFFAEFFGENILKIITSLLRLLILQLQRQRCNKLHRAYSLLCKFLQRWRCM